MDLYEIASRFSIKARTVTFNPGETKVIVSPDINRFGFAIITAPTDALSDMVYPEIFADQRFKLADWEARFEMRSDRHPGLPPLQWMWFSASGTTKIVLEYYITPR